MDYKRNEGQTNPNRSDPSRCFQYRPQLATNPIKVGPSVHPKKQTKTTKNKDLRYFQLPVIAAFAIPLPLNEWGQSGDRSRRVRKELKQLCEVRGHRQFCSRPVVGVLPTDTIMSEGIHMVPYAHYKIWYRSLLRSILSL